MSNGASDASSWRPLGVDLPIGVGPQAWVNGAGVEVTSLAEARKRALRSRAARKERSFVRENF